MPRGKKDTPASPKPPKPGEPGFETTFGFRLDQARSKRRMTDRSLARLVGVSHGAVHQWRHNTAYPGRPNLQRLLAVLPDLEVRDKPRIFGRPDEQGRPRNAQREPIVIDEEMQRRIYDFLAHVEPNEVQDLIDFSKRQKSLNEDWRRLFGAVVGRMSSGRSR
jgi:transcriptional regulator with XRE-family HTH domain